MLLKCAIAVGVWAFLPVSMVHASGGRALPAGEERAAVIEKLYSSPVGEVQFTDLGQGGHSAFLRNSRGGLMAFAEVQGGALCEDWFASTKWIALPEGCDFVFYNESDGRFLSVKSEEMEETNLFQAARGKLRGWRGGAHVAL